MAKHERWTRMPVRLKTVLAAPSHHVHYLAPGHVHTTLCRLQTAPIPVKAPAGQLVSCHECIARYNKE